MDAPLASLREMAFSRFHALTFHVFTPMLIAQLSDTHLAGGSRKTFNVAPMAENLARCVHHINTLQPQPDLVLLTGDVCNIGQPDEAERAARILSKLRFPLYLVPGNHDETRALFKAFGPNVFPVASPRFVNYVIDGYDIKLIGIDSTRPGHPGGEFTPEQASWLDTQLRAIGPQPVILFMHHPPAKFGVLETDEDGFIGADLLGDVLAAHGNVLRILAGHIHLTASTLWRNIMVSTAPSPGMRLALDLTLQQPSAFLLDVPAYQLHFWTPDKQLITHTVRLTEEETLYPFEEIT